MINLIDKADLERTRQNGERRGQEDSWTCGYCSTTTIQKGKTCPFCGAAELSSKDTQKLNEGDSNATHWRCLCGVINKVESTICGFCLADREWIK